VQKLNRYSYRCSSIGRRCDRASAEIESPALAGLGEFKHHHSYTQPPQVSKGV